MKIVLNKSWGGFHIRLSNGDLDYEASRTAQHTIDYAESGDNPYLKVVEIPDGVHYVICNYDGMETLYWSESPIQNC